MSLREEIKAQIWKQVLGVMRDAQAAGLHPFSEAQRAFPEVPGYILAQIEVDLWDEEENAWWEGIEKTIDAEVIRKALTKGGQSNG
ncbi:hypothetical protein GCM10007301_47820 [Azorhizobium oxalatiphilum]|uniref:Uncharacterized protein n=1 Tax=Azorhizobium oxalatiphilum TaxID=980631 RepID=A0A917CBF1_9HYPH|nr:hypothetical protein [Azorhizobium oxalatiphilum]GGF82142.1 hypothetical protein GCM10007301_47820 [Azorhizobium oxalatiphilum]